MAPNRREFLPASLLAPALIEAQSTAGKYLTDARKGLIGEVTLEGTALGPWNMYSLPLTDLSNLSFGHQHVAGPCFYRARFQVATAGYSFLDLRGWGKGYVWVNSHNCGRYWSDDPQRTSFVPTEWLNRGENEIVVLDLFEGGARSVVGRRTAINDMPEIPAAQNRS